MEAQRVRVDPAWRDGLVIRPSKTADPCLLMIFGATGDLARGKLLPALFHMHLDGWLPGHFGVLGLASRKRNDEDFRHEVAAALKRFYPELDLAGDQVTSFLNRCAYHGGDFSDPATFAGLGRRLAQLEADFGTGGNRLAFFATPASVFGDLLQNLFEASIVGRAGGPGPSPWSRVLIEKPFGSDLGSARALNVHTRRYLDEDQVFRVDHYLGKETVQNIIVFRFGNAIFEPLWNRKYIDHVQITAAESIGIQGRARFYEATGVLRDVVQNHLLQILALCAIESPVSFDADAIRDEKVKIFKSLRAIDGEPGNVSALGQYEGFLDEPGIPKASRTPTFAALRVMIDNWRWQGVPFYLRAGKGLARRTTEVAVHFKPVPVCLFGGPGVCAKLPGNVLLFKIQPDEGIRLRFVSKVPGDSLAISSVLMDFGYEDIFGKTIHDAYERLLLDAMRGDQTLFARADGVERQWAFLDPLIRASETGPPPDLYAFGSQGPVAADALLARDNRSWRPI